MENLFNQASAPAAAPAPAPKQEEKKGELKAEPVAQGGLTCDICYENYLEKDMHGIQACSHRFCLNCQSDYLEFNITNGKVKTIKCAD